MKKLPVSAVLMAIFCNILFGSAIPMIKLGYEQFNISSNIFSPILFAGIRFFISGIFVFLIDWIMHKKVPTVQKGNKLTVLFVALTYTFLQYVCSYIGISNTAGASASVINSTSVFIAAILAHFIYKDDKLTVKKLVGCLIGFAGVVLACLTGGGIGSGFTFMGEGFVLLTAFFFVLGSIINKKAAQKNTSFTITAYNLLIGGALLIVVGLIGYNGEMTVTPLGILVLLYLIFVSSVGFTIWSMLLRKHPIGSISVFNFILPVAGTIFSAIFLGENIFTWQYGVAALAVCVGIIIVNTSAKKKQADTPTKA